MKDRGENNIEKTDLSSRNWIYWTLFTPSEIETAVKMSRGETTAKGECTYQQQQQALDTVKNLWLGYYEEESGLLPSIVLRDCNMIATDRPGGFTAAAASMEGIFHYSLLIFEENSKIKHEKE